MQQNFIATFGQLGQVQILDSLIRASNTPNTLLVVFNRGCPESLRNRSGYRIGLVPYASCSPSPPAGRAFTSRNTSGYSVFGASFSCRVELFSHLPVSGGLPLSPLSMISLLPTKWPRIFFVKFSSCLVVLTVVKVGHRGQICTCQVQHCSKSLIDIAALLYTLLHVACIHFMQGHFWTLSVRP